MGKKYKFLAFDFGASWVSSLFATFVVQKISLD